MNIYTFTDADGASHLARQGADFVTEVQRIDTKEESDASMGAEIGSYVRCRVQHRYADLASFDTNLLARWKISLEVVADPTPPPEPIRPVSAMQIKRHLRTMARTDGESGSLRDQVEGLVAGSGDADLQDYWALTSDFHRDHPRLIAMVAALGLTSQQADAAFRSAALLY